VLPASASKALRHTGGKLRLAELSLQSNMAEPHGTGEDAAATTMAETSSATGKHRRSFSTATREGCYQEEHHQSISFGKSTGHPIIVSQLASFLAGSSETKKVV